MNRDIAIIGGMRTTFTRRVFIAGVTAAAIVPCVSPHVVSSSLAQETSFTPYLISPQDLSERLMRSEPNLLVMDLSDLWAYRMGHIPGAIHSWWLETIERDYPYYGTVLNQKALDSDADTQGKRRDWFVRHGIGRDTHVVAYDRNGGHRAARIVWFLRFLGHERASVMDGGLAAWQTSGLAISTADTSPPEIADPPEIVPREGFYVATGRLSELLDSGEIVLVDVRTHAELRDTVDGQFKTGVIPGSVHLSRYEPAFSIGNSRASFDANAARGVLNAARIDVDQHVVLYGQFGTDANQMWLVMKACGYLNVEIYDRGWVEWSESGLPYLPLT
jgi:thiosulfate/3-mercaptopyruvate sulfurtransferase